MMSIEQFETELRKEKLGEWHDQLKPCPFCGEEAHLICSTRYPKSMDRKAVLGISAVCMNYDCIIYNADTKYYLTEEEAVGSWNKRVLCVV